MIHESIDTDSSEPMAENPASKSFYVEHGFCMALYFIVLGLGLMAWLR